MSHVVKKPCNQCPFRKDCMPGWLGSRRAAEIAQSATDNVTFHCHKTTISTDEGDSAIGPDTQVCAGSVLLHLKEGRRNAYYRFIDKEVSGSELIFDSVSELIEHHSR